MENHQEITTCDRRRHWRLIYLLTYYQPNAGKWLSSVSGAEWYDRPPPPSRARGTHRLFNKYARPLFRAHFSPGFIQNAQETCRAGRANYFYCIISFTGFLGLVWGVIRWVVDGGWWLVGGCSKEVLAAVSFWRHLTPIAASN